MNITSYLLNKILLLHVEIDHDGIACKKCALVRSLKGKVIIGTWEDFNFKNIYKWKKFPALIVFSGDDIIYKEYDKQDTNNELIQKDSSFLWNIELNENHLEFISFMRKDKVIDFLQAINEQHLILIDTWIHAENIESSSLQIRLEKLYAEQFKHSALLKSDNSKGILANVLFKKIFFPVLLLFFVFLLGNYFLNLFYTKQYQQKQTILQKNIRENSKRNQEGNQRNHLIICYNQIPHVSFALLSDRIASYIPANMYLTSLDIFPIAKKNYKDKKELLLKYNIIHLKGFVETSGSVTLLCQFLEADNLFEKVKVNQLNRITNKNLFEFELIITLKG